MTIRTMRREDVDFAMQLAAAEGWNPGLHDADCFYAADHGGFFIGELEGEPVGCVSAVRYPEGFGFLGLYIVIPEHRGLGLGVQLWRRAMDNLSGAAAGLDGVPAQQENYMKSGFTLAYRNIRYQGQGGGDTPATVVPLDQIPYELIAACDLHCFPSRRDSFLRAWLGQEDAYGYAVAGDDGLAGWGLIRKCGVGWKIGPLYAESEQTAEDLYAALAAHAADDPVFLDVPEPNKAAMALAARHAMTPVFETARMYAGPAPDVDMDSIFGVTTFELG